MWRNLIVAAALAFSALDLPLAAAPEQEPEPVSGTAAPSAQADSGRAAASTPAPSSPWLLVPLVSSSPKLGTSLGAMGAYLHVFDPASRVSMFGLTYQYTTTHSNIAAAFARASIGADHHRVVALAVFGYIKNDYDDYLGTGQPLKTRDGIPAVQLAHPGRAVGGAGDGRAARLQAGSVPGAFEIRVRLVTVRTSLQSGTTR